MGSASTLPQYIPVSNTKFEEEKFEKGNFGLWKCEVIDMLVQMNLDYHAWWNPKSNSWCISYFKRQGKETYIS